MKINEINELANKIAAYEKIITNSQDTDMQQYAQNQIEILCQQVMSFDDMMALDEALMEKLNY